ncbi:MULTISPECIES: phosphatase PAP2 family protein [unclassified Leifsonia]|uniref:phosphatase PAP2 family protein n=1 Tax=unclassified Leifsonia TaxID=2663824 RepID=UPI0006F8DCD2|nr:MULTISPECIES: phosphatase PAP2 family protein [unclassified Leifsonia]KQX07236.1 phosphoesterase [Leifsonia sp. Root1293]KRA11519.1 phosphoesterase [Leifsonia sp. Root60]
MSSDDTGGSRRTDASAPAPGYRRRARDLNEKFIVEVRYVDPGDRHALMRTALILVIVGLALFVAILLSVKLRAGVSVIDEPFSQWAQSGRSPVLTQVMIVLAVAFGPIAMPIVILVTTVTWGVLAKHAWRPLLLAGGMLVGVVLAQIIAPLVQRPRPPVEEMLFGPDHTFSFPSGHVLGASNFVLLVTYLVFSRRTNRGSTIAAFVVAAATISILAVSRVYLGYHWPTDALGSISLSLAILGAVIALDTHRTVRTRSGDPQESVSG